MCLFVDFSHQEEGHGLLLIYIIDLYMSQTKDKQAEKQFTE